MSRHVVAAGHDSSFAEECYSSAVSPMKRASKTNVRRMRSTQKSGRGAVNTKTPPPPLQRQQHQQPAPQPDVAVVETEEVVELRKQLADITAAIAAEKRARARQKAKCEEKQTSLVSLQKELEGIDKKIETAEEFLRSVEGFDRFTLSDNILNLDAEMELVNSELKSTEKRLSELNAETGQKHKAKLQREVDKIRTADDAKKRIVWKKKVALLESTVQALEREVGELRQGRAAASSGASVSGGGSDEQSLEQHKQRYAAQLAKIQDDVTREAKQSQVEGAKSLEDFIKRNNALSVEQAHLEQQRSAKEAAVAASHKDVDALAKAVERSRKQREALEAEKQLLSKQRARLTEDVQAMHLKIQEASSTLNQLMMMTSNAPVMHEKAWQQEKALLQSQLNSVIAKNKKLDGELQALNVKTEAWKNDAAIEAQLCEQEAEVLKKVDRLRANLQSALAQQAAASHSNSHDDGSQKEKIVRDLDVAVKSEKRRLDEIVAMNERIEKKLSVARGLLQQHGFDI